MLERSGARVSYHAVDVRSGESVRACVGEIRRTWGPIQGIIHGAGVLADALIASQTDDQFDRVFGTKVDGLRHLLAATEGDPLEVLLVFSSVAGRLGNSAQAAYAMANEVLSTVAANERARRGAACLVRSLAWGPWAGGMVTPGLARLFEKAGVKLIALESGAEALAREIGSEDAFAQVILMNGDPPATAIPVNRAG
jgi:NAD(P)-dependent dehydrogenase (short-subunit alcohol dehydrogenase family)